MPPPAGSRPLHLRSGRNPFQRFIAFVAFAQGVTGLFGGAGLRSSAVQVAMPGWLTYSWYLAELVTGAILLSVVMIRDRPIDLFDDHARRRLRFQLQLEAGGLIGMGVASLGFATAVLAVTGGAGLTVAESFGGFLAAALARSCEIVVDLRKLRAVEHHAVLVDAPVLADPTTVGR
jgi:hypothetical protein